MKLIGNVFNPVHWSTPMYMNLMSGYIRKDAKVLDIGCGSGILSINASKLGAKKVTACDISDDAIRCTWINAKESGSDIEILHSDLNTSVKGKYDLILANLDMNEADRLMQTVSDSCHEGTVLIITWNEIMDRTELLKRFRVVREHECPRGYQILEAVHF